MALFPLKIKAGEVRLEISGQAGDTWYPPGPGLLIIFRESTGVVVEEYIEGLASWFPVVPIAGSTAGNVYIVPVDKPSNVRARNQDTGTPHYIKYVLLET